MDFFFSPFDSLILFIDNVLSLHMFCTFGMIKTYTLHCTIYKNIKTYMSYRELIVQKLFCAMQKSFPLEVPSKQEKHVLSEVKSL